MTRTLFTSVLTLVFTIPARAAEPESYHLVIYGGTSAGFSAGVQAAREGNSVIIIEPSNHLGGLTTGGLGWTDSGSKDAIGGISREFYQRIKKHYDQPAAWKFGKQEDYQFYRAKDDAMWTFEPHVAEQIMRDWLKELKVPVVYRQRLDRSGKGLKKDGQRIISITMESGKTYAGKMFIDATYEGDLMAAAGVSYHVGREANGKYNETLNGLQRAKNNHNHRFTAKVDPFVRPGDPKSGLLFGIEPDPKEPDGSGDHRMQAFCFRMCMSNVAENRVPFPKPEGYDESRHELLLRNFEAGDLRFPMKPDMMPNGKTDTNNNCAVSTDYIGQNYKYADGNYAERDKILKDHEVYQKGLMWTLANHPRVPKQIRDQMSKWGLPKDEFTDNGGWPHQIYVREARRMISDYVHSELDCRRTRETPQSVGMGSYNMDSHNCMRYVTKDGFVQNEGDIQVSPGGPYRISYLSIVPKKGECSNLLVPVCVSSSHIAYGSIRMEPVFMVLGQSAATAATIAMDDRIDVQNVDYARLRKRLINDKQILDLAAPAKPAAIDPKKLVGIVVDDETAERKGFEGVSSAIGPYVGNSYRHDGGMDRGKQTARFIPDIPEAGIYEVRIAYTVSNNRATNVGVAIFHAGPDRKTLAIVNQRKAPPIDKTWLTLGKYRFDKGKSGYVEFSNEGVDGHVIIDAVQWIKVKE